MNSSYKENKNFYNVLNTNKQQRILSVLLAICLKLLCFSTIYAGEKQNSSKEVLKNTLSIDSTYLDKTQTVADMNLQELANLQISPFEVSTRFDSGYRTSNSVSGSRFDAQIKELPFAIQAFNESFIKDQKPVNIFDVARYSPGVTYRSNDFNEGNANMSIRGFAIGSLAGGNIHILRDGFHGPSIFDFTNISRVEVLKGPSSFLYGQVAPGGIVNIITKSPQTAFDATASVRYGSYNQYRCEADVTGPISNVLFYRISASYDEDMHYWKPYNAHSLNISPSFTWKPINRLSFSIKYEHFSKKENPQVMQKPGYNIQNGLIPTITDPNLSGVDVPGLSADWNSMSFSDYRYSETNSLNGWIDYKQSDHWDIRGGYSLQTYKIDALFSGNLGMSDNSTSMQGRRLKNTIYTNNDNTVQLDAVGLYDFDWVNLRILCGGQFVDRQFDLIARQSPNNPALGSNPIASPLPLWDLSNPLSWNRDISDFLKTTSFSASRSDSTVKYYDKSIYVSTTLSFLNNRLLFLTGWRYTSTDSRLTYNILNKSFTNNTSMITPQYGVLYKLDPELSLFASYSESFVPGTFTITTVDRITSIPKPTKGRGYDVGIKADLFDGHLSGTLTCFDISNENIINDISLTNNQGIKESYYIQSGMQRSNGLEMDATIKATKNWQIYLSYSYMDARITKVAYNDHTILAQDTATLDAAGKTNYKNVLRYHDKPLQMSAPHLANLWTRYNFSIGVLKGLSLAGGANFVFNQTILPDGPLSSHQTYTLVNATVGYSWLLHGIHLGIDLMGKNLLNEYYRPSQSSRSRPMEFILTLTAKFN
jgi:iron complex outermembrane recepter protein